MNKNANEQEWLNAFFMEATKRKSERERTAIKKIKKKECSKIVLCVMYINILNKLKKTLI